MKSFTKLKYFFSLILIIYTLLFSSCQKYLISGTGNHSLNDEIEINNFNENIIEYNSNYIQYKFTDIIGYYDSKYFYTNSTKIYYKIDGQTKRITKIECLKNDVKNEDIIKYFKSSHHLISKSEITYKYRDNNYYNSKKYIFNDKYTQNELIVIKFDDNLLISYISPDFEEKQSIINQDFSNYSQINGTDGFVLGMKKNKALDNLAKIGFKVITNNSYSSYKYDGINTYYASHSGKKYEQLYMSPYFDEMKSYLGSKYFDRESLKRIAIDFIEDLNGQQILTAYYTTDYWINEKKGDYTDKTGVFSNFIEPLTKKYHLKSISTRKYEPNDADYAYTYIFDDINNNKLQITLLYNNNDFSTIRIEYSIDEELIASYQKRLDEAEKNTVNKGNNSIVDKL